MKKWISVSLFVLSFGAAKGALAIQLDWSGQFWFDNHWLNNYQLSRARPGYDNDTWLQSRGGPFVPGNGEKNVVWYSSFLKLKPKAVVNDSINVRSELHLGSPIYGFFGRGYPTTFDERFNITGSEREAFTVGAERFWANLITDFGNVDLGRAPRGWGLGALWDPGDELFDRYQSTGDMIRLTSKFGNFSLQPALIKVAMGTNVAGATDFSGQTIAGNDDVTDLELAAKYDNPEEDFDFGMMWTRRAGNIAQRSVLFNASNPTVGSRRIGFNIFDFYARKKMGRFSIAGELPLFSGNIGAVDGISEYEYKTYALVLEGKYTSDLWDVDLKAGHIPGQQPTVSGDTKFRAVYLNKNYNLGLIMFHYNLYGLGNNNPDTVASGSINSPYDSPLVNANYLGIFPQLKLDKWTLKWAVLLGYAVETAESGRKFYNYQQRKFYDAVQNQASFLGKEFDFGIDFRWDENFLLSWDLGVFFPGAYYAFSNDPGLALDLDWMFASQVRAGITF